MRYLYLILASLILFLPHLAKAEWESALILQQDELISPTITSPATGQAVQGSVVLWGNSAVDLFQSYEVDFAYSADPTHTWFLIQESTYSIDGGILAVWDTTRISDGDYTLRLVVNLTNSSQLEATIPVLRVRNYSSVQTDTSSSITSYVNVAPGELTPTAASLATPIQGASTQSFSTTPLPTNPAEISSSQVMLTFGKGAAFTIGLFVILGAYLGIRAILYNRK